MNINCNTTALDQVANEWAQFDLDIAGIISVTLGSPGKEIQGRGEKHPLIELRTFLRKEL